MIHDDATLESLLDGTTAEIVRGATRYEISLETSPPCTRNCPAGINVKGYVNLIAHRRYEEALALIRESNPFPGICGRVCTHPCEANCTRAEENNALSIRALKRFVSDYEVSRTPPDVASSPPVYPQRIAIIGAGPAGLTAAVDLTRLGYGVTVFEASGIPGGMMVWGIPGFRLPRSVIMREIDLIRSMGVSIRTGTPVTEPASLLRDGYSAVIAATGAWGGMRLGIPGEELSGVNEGLAFLRQVYDGTLTSLTGHAVVIGGGDSAVDAARTALRLGASRVTLAYRRTETEMPANPAEVREAVEEGVEILTLVIPRHILGTGTVDGIEFQRAELGAEDDSGRRRPVPVEGSEFTLPCDTVIPMIGAHALTRDLEGSGIPFTPWNTVEARPDGSTSVPGLFALGDAVRGPSTIVDVMGDAHICAASVHSFLREANGDGTEGGTPHARPRPAPRGAVLRTPPPEVSGRIPVPILDPDTRARSFDEATGGYSELAARTEASRCNVCGPCTECVTCLPDCGSKQVLALTGGNEFLLKVPCDLSRSVHGAQIPPGDPDHPDQPGHPDPPGPFQLITADGERKPLELRSLTPSIDSTLCFACGRCEAACAYRAIRVGLKRGGIAYATMEHDLCRSCGRCVLVCPSGALTLYPLEDGNLIPRLERSIRDNDGIAVFACPWSLRDDRTTAVELMCAVGITPAVIIQSFALGARGVLIAHCPEESDHYLPVEYGVRDVVDATLGVTAPTGIGTLRIRTCSSTDLLREIGRFRSFLDGEGLHSPSPPSPHISSDPSFDPPTHPPSGSLPDPPTRPPSYPPNDPCAPGWQEPIRGRIGRAMAQLLPHTTRVHGGRDGAEQVNHTTLMGNLLAASGQPDTLGMIRSIGKIAETLHLDLDPATIPDAMIAPQATFLPCIGSGARGGDIDTATGTGENNRGGRHGTMGRHGTTCGNGTRDSDDTTTDHMILPELILGHLRRSMLHRIPVKIGIHPACPGGGGGRFISAFTEIITLVTGSEPVLLDRLPCGSSHWRCPDARARERAIALHGSAEALGVNVIVPVSPDCLTHLRACNRPGAWRHSSVRVEDIYTLVLSALTGGEHRE